MILQEQRYVRENCCECVAEFLVFEFVIVEGIGSGELSAFGVVGLIRSRYDELATRGEDAPGFREE